MVYKISALDTRQFANVDVVNVEFLENNTQMSY